MNFWVRSYVLIHILISIILQSWENEIKHKIWDWDFLKDWRDWLVCSKKKEERFHPEKIFYLNEMRGLILKSYLWCQQIWSRRNSSAKREKRVLILMRKSRENGSELFELFGFKSNDKENKMIFLRVIYRKWSLRKLLEILKR